MNIQPRRIRIGNEAVASVRVWSPGGRAIVSLGVDFQQLPGTAGVPIAGADVDLAPVRQFTFRPQVPGVYTAVVTAEDDAGCITSVAYGTPIEVRP